jgi:hypothetical protein
MIDPEIAFADLSDNAVLAEALLKYTFAALLNEREEDLAFFDQRIEKGLVAKLEGIVGSEFVHMDYGEAIKKMLIVGPGLTLRRRAPRFRGQGAEAMSSQSEVIETTVSQVADELVRRGLDPEDRVTITIEPDELIPGRREARARVVAAGLSDEDIDRLINEARAEAQSLLG